MYVARNGVVDPGAVMSVTRANIPHPSFLLLPLRCANHRLAPNITVVFCWYLQIGEYQGAYKVGELSLGVAK